VPNCYPNVTRPISDRRCQSDFKDKDIGGARSGHGRVRSRSRCKREYLMRNARQTGYGGAIAPFATDAAELPRISGWHMWDVGAARPPGERMRRQPHCGGGYLGALKRQAACNRGGRKGARFGHLDQAARPGAWRVSFTRSLAVDSLAREGSMDSVQLAALCWTKDHCECAGRMLQGAPRLHGG